MELNESNTNEILHNDIDESSLNIGISKKKKCFLIGSIILIVLALIIIIPCVILLSNKEKNNSKETEDYDPVPKNEDLDFTEEEHRLFSRNVAAQSMVLAKNDKNILPLHKKDQIVLFGEGTTKTVYGGWGSGEVYIKGKGSTLVPIHVIEGILNKSNEGKLIYKANDKGYEIGPNLTDSDVEILSRKGTDAERSIAVFTISRRSGEALDRGQDQSDSGTLLTDAELLTYDSLKKYFDYIVVVLNVGGVMELNNMQNDNKTSILIAFLPGMEAGNAIADVLVGDVNPSGHLSDTWAEKIDDYPTTSTFLESLQYVKYKEGLFVGYRYFEDDEEKQKKVVFPFGFGLSYTKFSINSTCNIFSDTIIINSTIKNIGERSGKEVVQIYVKKPQNENFIKVRRELVAFAKTKELNKGEEQTLKMLINIKDLASYDDSGIIKEKATYVLEEGDYLFYVGNSVAETRGDDIAKSLCKYHQGKTEITEKLITRLKPKDPEVENANIKPNFTDFMYKTNNLNNKNMTKKIKNKEETFQTKTKDENGKIEYNFIPNEKINEINFKTVLQKKYTMKDLVDSMSDEELAFLSFGHSAKVRMGTGTIGGFYNAGITGKYLIPSGDTNDGPAGLRQSEVKMGSTGWPCSTSLASTFDLELIEKVGEKTGKEARRIGTSFWLAPGMNIHRNPLCGRNFEYYSEDPFLTGKTAATITKGVQSKRVSITLKHLCANNKEMNRDGRIGIESLASDSRMAERVAREIYLKGFEIAVKEGKPWSIMSSYNRINGMKTSESYDLLTGILRNEWKFDGLVMSDWNTNSEHDRETHAGNDVKMPTNDNLVSTILNSLKTGLISRNELKRNILRVCNVLAKTHSIDILFHKPDPINLSRLPKKIKIYDNLFNRAEKISYEDCKDMDGGYNPTQTITNSWVSIYVTNENEEYKNIRVRYASKLDGFGFSFKTKDRTLGELTNLEKTGDLQTWSTSPEASIYLPKGEYEIIIMFLGYDYTEKDNYKGNINWIEFL